MFLLVKVENGIHYLIEKKIHSTVNQLINQKKWYYENQEDILDKLKVKGLCECGTLIRLADKSKHQRTKKHFKLMSQKASHPA